MKKILFFIWVLFVLLLRLINNITSINWILNINEYYDSMKPLNRLFSFILMIVMPFLILSLFYDINVEKNGIIIYVSTLSIFVFLRMIPVIHELINTEKKNLNGL